MRCSAHRALFAPIRSSRWGLVSLAALLHAAALLLSHPRVQEAASLGSFRSVPLARFVSRLPLAQERGYCMSPRGSKRTLARGSQITRTVTADARERENKGEVESERAGLITAWPSPSRGFAASLGAQRQRRRPSERDRPGGENMGQPRPRPEVQAVAAFARTSGPTGGTSQVPALQRRLYSISLQRYGGLLFQDPGWGPFLNTT